MRRLLRRALDRVAPRWTAEVSSARARAHAHRLVESWGCGALNRKLIERLGTSVREGPFAGLTLSPMTRAEHLGPYLLGVYESELDEAWEAVFRRTYSQIVDVGAKFGYYAVGLARRYPDVPVAAFDTDPWARRAVREMAAANGTPNVEALSYCEPGWLVRELREGAFIISDCEGYEGTLFGREVLPALRAATLIIETHDQFVPGVGERLRKDLGATHDVRVFGEGESRRASSLDLGFLSEEERRRANDDIRSEQLWLLCVPKGSPR
ncbi:MAG: hypothetical protein ACJ76N_19125 [Thermoanaerobaculia bacterium]